MNCTKCGNPPDGTPWYVLTKNNEQSVFCSRICLVEFIAPELSKAIAVKQWVPTPEEEARMSQ